MSLGQRGGRRLIGRTAAVAVALAMAGYGVASTAVAERAPASPDRSAPARAAGATAARTASSPFAQLSRGGAAAGRTVHYAVAEHLCGRPAAGAASCDAIRLVASSRGAAGAKAYVSAAASTGPAGGFTPADLASAYRFDPTGAVHQTIAIIDAYDDPHALGDLDAFDAQYGLPRETAASMRKVNESGRPSPLPAANAGWSGEIALDIETSRAVCHHCTILLVEGASSSDTDLATAVDTAARLGATEISNSYGEPENSKGATAVQSAYNHPGIVITASTGDHGWYDWDYANDGTEGASDNAPNTPAAYPTVVAVGGTSLALASNGARAEEDVWNEDGADDDNGLFDGDWLGSQGASGGGCSPLFAAPAWQAGVARYSGTGCGSRRLVDDVSALADPYTGFDIYDSYSNGWVTVGGTSLSSPLVAAMWALAGGSGGVAYPAQTLYANSSARPGSIYDVRAGGNSFCAGDSTSNCSSVLEAQTAPPTGNPNNLDNGNSFRPHGWAGLLDCGYNYDGGPGLIAQNTQCNAATGYDDAGVGTPAGLGLFQSDRPTIRIARPRVLKLRAPQVWSAVGFADSVPGDAPTRYGWSWGDGTTSTTTGGSIRHRFTRAGKHRVTLTVTDRFGQTGSTAVVVTVGVRPAAVISGPRSVHLGATVTWRSLRNGDRNTGGRVTGWVWKIGNTRVGTHPRLAHRFTAPGRHTLTLIVIDNSGLRRSETITITVVR